MNCAYNWRLLVLKLINCSRWTQSLRVSIIIPLDLLWSLSAQCFNQTILLLWTYIECETILLNALQLPNIWSNSHKLLQSSWQKPTSNKIVLYLLQRNVCIWNPYSIFAFLWYESQLCPVWLCSRPTVFRNTFLLTLDDHRLNMSHQNINPLKNIWYHCLNIIVI